MTDPTQIGRRIDRDPFDDIELMDSIQLESERKEKEVMGSCDPIEELCCDGDPGRGKIDAPGSGDGWVESGPNHEEALVDEVDDLVSSIDDNWDLNGFEL